MTVVVCMHHVPYDDVHAAPLNSLIGQATIIHVIVMGQLVYHPCPLVFVQYFIIHHIKIIYVPDLVYV